jgi:hypothetical protein
VRRKRVEEARATRNEARQTTQTYQDLADPLRVSKNIITGFVPLCGTRGNGLLGMVA